MRTVNVSHKLNVNEGSYECMEPSKVIVMQNITSEPLSNRVSAIARFISSVLPISLVSSISDKSYCFIVCSWVKLLLLLIVSLVKQRSIGVLIGSIDHKVADRKGWSLDWPSFPAWLQHFVRSWNFYYKKIAFLNPQNPVVWSYLTGAASSAVKQTQTLNGFHANTMILLILENIFLHTYTFICFVNMLKLQ